jgi:protein-disulfide isomerase
VQQRKHNIEQEPYVGLAEAVGATDHVLGPPYAPVIVVEYGDFECPTCKQAAPAVEMLLRRFPNKVCFVFRHFPLEEAHPHALDAAQAAECAAAQGKFWEMHKMLFEHQSHLDRGHLRSYAEQIGIDVPRFVADFDDEVYLQRVREHIDSGKRSGVKSTPGFFINGRIQDVSFGMHQIVEATEAALHGHH